MKTCCFCFNRKSGTLATAISGLVIKTIAIITLSSLYGVLRQTNIDYYRYWEYYRRDDGFEVSDRTIRTRQAILLLDGGFIPAIIETAISIIFCILLILGVTKGNKCLFWPWFVLTGLEILGGFLTIIISFILANNISDRVIIVVVGILTAFQVYCFPCVVAHYRDVQLTSNRTQGMVIGVPYQQMPHGNEGLSVPHAVNVHSQQGTSLQYVISSTPNPPDYDVATSSGLQTKD